MKRGVLLALLLVLHCTTPIILVPNAEQFELTPQTIKASQEQESGLVIVSVEFAIDKNLTTGAIAVAAIAEEEQASVAPVTGQPGGEPQLEPLEAGEPYPPIWIELAFNDVYPISDVIIYQWWFTDYPIPETGVVGYCVTTILQYEYCKSLEGDVNIDVYRDGVMVKRCGTMSYATGASQEEQIFRYSCNETLGDRVVLTKDDIRGLIVLYEIVVTSNNTAFSVASELLEVVSQLSDSDTVNLDTPETTGHTTPGPAGPSGAAQRGYTYSQVLLIAAVVMYCLVATLS